MDNHDFFFLIWKCNKPGSILVTLVCQPAARLLGREGPGPVDALMVGQYTDVEREGRLRGCD